jgi:hypothetical protein
MSTFYGDNWKFSIIGDISPSGNIMPRPFDMQAYIKSIDGVSEWLASLPFDDENYELSVDVRASAHDITPIGNQYKLNSLIMAIYKVKLRRIVGGLEEVFLATFHNGQKCDESYTATIIPKPPYLPVTFKGEYADFTDASKWSLSLPTPKNELEKFHEELIEAMHEPVIDTPDDDDEEEDYYDQVWR